MILLNFDMEEFDLPSEHNVNLPLDEQMEYSKEGSVIVLDLLEKYQIKATFFCTAVFALNARELISDIIQRGMKWLHMGTRIHPLLKKIWGDLKSCWRR